MFEWFNNLLTELDSESVTILGTGVAAVIVGVLTSLRGMAKGKPNSSVTAQAITQMSCGAPEIKTELLGMRHNNRELMTALDRIQTDIDRLGDKVTRIEDRTRRMRVE